MTILSSSRYTNRQRILDYLATVTPRQQCEIANALLIPASSVRREVQQLRREGLLVNVDDLFGYNSNFGPRSAPRVALTPRVADVMTAATYDIAPLTPEMIGAIS